MAKMVTLIGAKWREFAQIVAQRNKDKDDGSLSEKERGDTSRDGATSGKEEEVTDTETRDNGEYLDYNEVKVLFFLKCWKLARKHPLIRKTASPFQDWTTYCAVHCKIIYHQIKVELSVHVLLPRLINF